MQIGDIYRRLKVLDPEAYQSALMTSEIIILKLALYPKNYKLNAMIEKSIVSHTLNLLERK